MFVYWVLTVSAPHRVERGKLPNRLVQPMSEALSISECLVLGRVGRVGGGEWCCGAHKGKKSQVYLDGAFYTQRQLNVLKKKNEITHNKISLTYCKKTKQTKNMHAKLRNTVYNKI